MIRELNNPQIEAQLEDAARAWAQIQEMRQRRAAPAPTPATPSAKRAKAESPWTKSLDAAIESFERVREELRSRRPPTPAGPPDTPDAAWPAHPIEEHFKLSSTNPYDPAATLQAHSLLTCTRCDDGMVQEVDERGYRFLVPCRCQPWTRHADRLNRAALPAAALYNDLKTMDFTRVRSRRHIPQGQVASGPRNLSDLQMEITRVLAGATRAATDGRQSWRAGLLLYGKTGVGKTHVLHALARKLTLESGQSLTWLHWPSWLERSRVSMRPGAAESIEALWASIKRSRVLIVDELGAGNKTNSEFAEAQLLALIDFVEQSKGRVTLLASSNKAPTELTEARAVSRLFGVCEIVEVVADDYRRLG